MTLELVNWRSITYAPTITRFLCERAAGEGMGVDATQLNLLGDEEVALIREAASFPRIVEAAAKADEPHRIAL